MVFLPAYLLIYKAGAILDSNSFNSLRNFGVILIYYIDVK